MGVRVPGRDDDAVLVRRPKITPELVNYDGNYPYAGGEKGLYRRRRCRWPRCRRIPGACTRCTATSGSGAPTGAETIRWTPQVDPQGPQSGGHRVLRGGSWLDNGRYVRSARRIRVRAWRPLPLLGFRLALGPAVRKAHPYALLAMVVLPEHLHSIWRLPAGDANFALRWALIKGGFSRSLPRNEIISASRQGKRERGIWQRRYWEHHIRDEIDLERHIDYIHYNPVKHGWVKQPTDWPHSTLHAYIERGIVAADWGRR
jgi:putative transposase